MDYFKFLPSEVTVDILSRVPAESISNCKSVCKNWRRLVHRPSFSKMHLNRHNDPSSDTGKLGFVASTQNHDTMKFWYFEYNDDENQSTTPIERIRRINFTSPFKDTRFVGSSNGLICLSSVNQEPLVCICNPIAREYVVLPQITTDSDIGIHLGRVVRFGYVASSNEYKVVQICYLSFDEIMLHIYTLGSGTGWRNLGFFECEIDLYGTSIANGSLYWMAIEYEMIITFDLSEEKFCQDFAPPPLPQNDVHTWENNRTGVLNGYLCFAVWVNIEGDDYYDIWLLKKKNDYHDVKEQEVHQSMVWNREFRIHKTNFLAVTKTGNVLTYMENYLSIYDPQASTSKMLMDFKESFCQVFPHKNTLVSLKELGEEDTTRIESVEEDD